MDFFQFLKKTKQSSDSNTENLEEKPPTEHNNKKEITNTNTTTNEITDTTTNEITNRITNETGHILYKNVKKGNMVRIIYNENSILNLYKGYIGEIRDYKKEHDFAIVFLHGINSQTFIKCPLQHFIVL
jgi:hypothetical protein